MTKSITTIVGVLIAAGVTHATAQQHQHRQGAGQAAVGRQGSMQGMGPGMALRVYQPAQLLEQRDTLGLTADQVAQLEAIEAEMQQARTSAMATHDDHRNRMMEAIQAEQWDSESIQTHFMAAHAAMGMAHWAEMDAGLKARAVLTDAQREKVAGPVPGGGMQHRHGQGVRP